MNHSMYPRYRRRWLASVLTLFLLVGCSDREAGGDARPDEDKATPVLTEEASRGVERTFVEAIGTSRALKSVSLESAVEGEVTEVNFSTGDYVEKGQTLVRLDDRDERLAVQLAEVELEDAERRLDRYRRSVQSGGVTVSDLDDARSEVERAEIALRRAQVELDHHTIEAPFSGYVGITDIDPGAWIRSDTEITTLDDRSTLLVRFQLPELLLGKLEPGETVQLSTWSDQFAIARGDIVDVSSRVDETRRTFTLRAHVDNENDLLRPGMSFRIQMTLDGNRYILVPEIALQWGGEGAYVWGLNEEGEAERLMVNVVQRQEDGVLVDGDLTEGTVIVTEGVHVVREGMRVRPLNRELGKNDREDDDRESSDGEES